MYAEKVFLDDAVNYLKKLNEDCKIKRNLYLPGDGRYQPPEIKVFLGYDNWAAWLIIVEWFWMLTLAKIGIMPAKDAKYLTYETLCRMLKEITTKKVDDREYGRDGCAGTGHDILALIEKMRRYLPRSLWRWLHLGLTSYDTICTAYALQAKLTYQLAFWPKLLSVDEIWRNRIKENAEVLQEGRTHLQPALPITLGFWLASLHNRFVSCARKAFELSNKLPGKLTGATGTSAAIINLTGSHDAEAIMMGMLELPMAQVTTQIVPPEANARYYLELALMSGALGNFGEDCRLLMSHWVGEIVKAGDASTSSTMAHKDANPISAEQDCGMHVNVIAESMKVMLTLVSDLQRDLRWSSVMRSYSAAMVYVYQQIKTTEKILKNLTVNRDRCQSNFEQTSKMVMAELLHTSLQMGGYLNSHHLTNKTIVPKAKWSGRNLAEETDTHIIGVGDEEIEKAWKKVPEGIKYMIAHPKFYIGNAVGLSRKEMANKL